jgi:hypothetical protein
LHRYLTDSVTQAPDQSSMSFRAQDAFRLKARQKDFIKLAYAGKAY